MQKIYKRGSRKEYKIIEDLKKEGCQIAQRTAGSHSPIDIIGIDRVQKVIKFIQSKRTLSENMNYIDPKLKTEIEKELSWLNGTWYAQFEVR